MSTSSAITGLWTAVMARDERADGTFVYAVRSTGVYCRPSCASRRPRPDRVEFFPSPSAAAAHGYRACRRCQPDLPTPIASSAIGRVRRVCEAVAREPDAPWSRARLARSGGATVAQMQRAFRSVLGISPHEYVAACRRRRFLGTIRGGAPVTEATYAAGYGSPSRVYESWTLPGMTPATYGRGGAGTAIEWATTDSPLGRLLVASTSRGLCFVEIGSDDAALAAALRDEFPNAEIAARPSARLRPLARAARAAAEAKPLPTDLPVDIRGTAFQWRVWRALTKIPAGRTTTYADLARAIGAPAAVRAVGRACATNPIALFVPCHRAIGSDGALHGYRWGLDKKARLLELERRRHSRKDKSVAR